MKENLGSLVADCLVMFVKLHNIHWHVKGSHFFQIHKLTESLYNNFADYYDDLAERLLGIGGNPPVTMQESLAMSSIAEDSRRSFFADEALNILLEDLKSLSDKILQITEEAGSDKVTEDILVGFLRDIQKNIWLLESARN